MPHYIAAFGATGNRILGNLDGQASIPGRRPERSRAWTELGKSIRASARVHHWKLEDEHGNVLAMKLNPGYKEYI